MHERALRLLGVLAAVLLGAAIVVLGGALLPATSLGLAVAALALVVAAATCWRIRRSIAADLRDSRAWAEVARLRAVLDEHEALWQALPAPAAAWDAAGQFVRATAAWQRLGVPTSGAPDQPELSIGEPARVFVIERAEQPSGVRLVLLREVTRERQALQAKDELLATVGHELRTPLSSIKGYGQLMARQLATVQEQVQRLDQLIGDVLDTARAEGGRLALRREALSIPDLVRSAAEHFRAAHPQQRIELELLDCPLVEGDAVRLAQVLDNLLSNAAKYAPAETAITLRVSVSGDGKWVRIDVVDRGAGISPEHLPRLFDRFYRVPGQDSGGPSGFGLGLSIVRDLVEAHGGHVEAASAGRGRGSTFTIVLPAARLGSAPGDHGPRRTRPESSGAIPVT